MRAIGEIRGETSARTFNDFLYAQGIGAEIERGDDRTWTVWVKSEDDFPRAAELLRAFRENPDDPVFQGASSAAAELRRRADEDQASYERRVRNARKSFASLKGYTFGPLTYALIFICAVVFVVTKFGKQLEPVNALLFSEHINRGPLLTRWIVPELLEGQVWRLLTPIFIHMGVIHIFFNMMWLADLGSMIEDRQGAGLLGRLVVVLGIGSNVTQYVLTGYPRFGGMSGVVYGLIGYMWIRSKFDPTCGLQLHPQTVSTAIIWFFFCFSPYAGPIANGAHAGGLVLGMIWGWLASRRPASR